MCSLVPVQRNFRFSTVLTAASFVNWSNQSKGMHSVQIARLLQSPQPDGWDQSVPHSPHSKRSQTVHNSCKASAEEGGKISNILDFLDAVSQQVLWTEHIMPQL